ncbi:MAG: hypothetical protein E7537_03115 [Ruminococcaceae bacterium]|nr:hypothetical protein [Oscillospiraceae bacterium]
MINNFQIAKELLEQNGEITGATQGDSMKPLFRSGLDKAVIVTPPETLHVGDVLLYKNKTDNQVNLHRIVKITKQGPVLRGDNLYVKETNIPSEDIIGILKGFYRGNKYYDCKLNTGYKIYVFYILASYPLRRLLKKFKSAFLKLKNLLEK